MPAKHSEEAVDNLRKNLDQAVEHSLAGIMVDSTDGTLIIEHIDFLRREYRMVQERFNLEMLALSERLNDMFNIVKSIDSITPDEPEKFVENEIKRVLRDYAALRQLHEGS